ncbi:NADH dehydrogenase [ubiquinone] 1 alpha subcomplex assembly factor 4 [Galendromus occidentalis]|uniref:NADH dehydrogenase [ubiquinone] 1 alpha subcomplex assembly factor 4 n=1 Tax=Galendromus occidentalis TaxID=34638 RepID=A0AAJ6VYU4_9ACAR|nr:NADH dehydrogenase [ubiquinone] 1 alpha subcomplex assembly factor 4 [Galendromus occidentalis]
MGNAIRRTVTKPFRSFNVENRAQRVLSREKPVQAPHYETAQQDLPKEMQEQIRSKIVSRSDALNERLRDVRVVSDGVNPEIKRIQENLPRDRFPSALPAYGFVEPKSVPKGKLSLSQSISLLEKHYSNPAKYTAAEAAKEFHLDVRDAELIIEYYMPLTLMDPESPVDMAKLGVETRTELQSIPEHPDIEREEDPQTDKKP